MRCYICDVIIHRPKINEETKEIEPCDYCLSTIHSDFEDMSEESLEKFLEDNE